MLKHFCFFCIIIILGFNSYGQQDIINKINDNLMSRYTNFEVISITQDSCPDMNYLFSLSLRMKIVASECKLNISKAILRYYQNEINLEKTFELCQYEVDRIASLAKSWNEAYFLKSEKCLLVKYRYGNSNGIKTTVEDYYSLDENEYKEGNYPYLKKEFDAYYGQNLYKDVVKKYEDFLLEIANG